jgi:hypothetical protein
MRPSKGQYPIHLLGLYINRSWGFTSASNSLSFSRLPPSLSRPLSLPQCLSLLELPPPSLSRLFLPPVVPLPPSTRPSPITPVAVPHLSLCLFEPWLTRAAGPGGTDMGGPGLVVGCPGADGGGPGGTDRGGADAGGPGAGAGACLDGGRPQ